MLTVVVDNNTYITVSDIKPTSLKTVCQTILTAPFNRIKNKTVIKYHFMTLQAQPSNLRRASVSSIVRCCLRSFSVVSVTNGLALSGRDDMSCSEMNLNRLSFECGRRSLRGPVKKRNTVTIVKYAPCFDHLAQVSDGMDVLICASTTLSKSLSVISSIYYTSLTQLGLLKYSWINSAGISLFHAGLSPPNTVLYHGPSFKCDQSLKREAEYRA